MQCASCREKGRLDARAYSERQREKMRGGGINVEDEEPNNLEGSRSGSESVVRFLWSDILPDIEHHVLVDGKRNLQCRTFATLFSLLDHLASHTNIRNRSFELRLNRTALYTNRLWRYSPPSISVQIRAVCELQGETGYRVQEMAGEEAIEGAGGFRRVCRAFSGFFFRLIVNLIFWQMENVPSDAGPSKASSPFPIISPVTPTSATDSLSSALTQRRCTRIGCGVILPPLSAYNYVQCEECKEKQRIATKKWQEKKKLREREALSGQSSSAVSFLLGTSSECVANAHG